RRRVDVHAGHGHAERARRPHRRLELGEHVGPARAIEQLDVGGDAARILGGDGDGLALLDPRRHRRMQLGQRASAAGADALRGDPPARLLEDGAHARRDGAIELEAAVDAQEVLEVADRIVVLAEGDVGERQRLEGHHLLVAGQGLLQRFMQEVDRARVFEIVVCGDTLFYEVTLDGRARRSGRGEDAHDEEEGCQAKSSHCWLTSYHDTLGLAELVLRRSLIVVVAGAVTLGALVGCGPGVTKRACMGGAGDSNPLVTDAAMLRLDVYGAGAHCADGQLAAGAGTPILSHTYANGEAISLDVPPGQHAIVLSTFADSDATQLLGVGCTEADLSAGSQICFDLTVEPAPDGGDDLSGAMCMTSPDDCPTGQYCNGIACVPGCKADSDCPKTDAGTGVCDTTTHTCENCVADRDCGSAPGAACCNKHCTNVKSDPLNC